MIKVSFVIPVYRSENTISLVVDSIVNIMSDKLEYDYEIVLVNDCSPDNVWRVIKDMCHINAKIKAIDLAKNFGQHSALMAGYNYSSGDYVITLDDDGQTPVDQSFILIDKLQQGYDVVYGKYIERKDNSFRKFGTVLNNYMLETLVGKPKDLHLTSFFVMRKNVADEICNYQGAFPYIWGLVLRTTKSIANAEINHSERTDGESGYTLKKLLNLWMNGATAFSVKPLRVSGGIGLFSAALGLLGLLYIIVNKIIHPETVAGYSSIMVVILIIGGLLLLSIGLIGEYIGRIYLCINNSPQFVVRTILNEEKHD